MTHEISAGRVGQVARKQREEREAVIATANGRADVVDGRRGDRLHFRIPKLSSSPSVRLSPTPCYFALRLTQNKTATKLLSFHKINEIPFRKRVVSVFDSAMSTDEVQVAIEENPAESKEAVKENKENKDSKKTSNSASTVNGSPKDKLKDKNKELQTKVISLSLIEWDL